MICLATTLPFLFLTHVAYARCNACCTWAAGCLLVTCTYLNCFCMAGICHSMHVGSMHPFVQEVLGVLMCYTWYFSSSQHLWSAGLLYLVPQQ